MPRVDLTGRTFGRLTVLERAGTRPPPQQKALWRCRCACGSEVTVPTNYLTSGDTRSCGCLHNELAAAKGRARAIDLTGQTFGRLTVCCRAGSRPRSARGRGEILWLCSCACGRSHVTTGGQLRRGACLSCGCLRDELKRARAATVGALQRVKACRTCGGIYLATGPQKDCSPSCKLRHHAQDEALRRAERSQVEMMQSLTELERRYHAAP